MRNKYSPTCSMNDKHNSHGVLDNKIVSKSTCKNLGVQTNDDLESIKSFADSVITPSATPPVPENTLETFMSLLKECFKFECNRCIGFCKVIWGKKLLMRFSRRA